MALEHVEPADITPVGERPRDGAYRALPRRKSADGPRDGADRPRRRPRRRVDKRIRNISIRLTQPEFRALHVAAHDADENLSEYAATAIARRIAQEGEVRDPLALAGQLEAIAARLRSTKTA